MAHERERTGMRILAVAILAASVAAGVLAADAVFPIDGPRGGPAGIRTDGVVASAAVRGRTAWARGRTIDHLTVHHTASPALISGERVEVSMVAAWHRARGIGAGYKDSRACAYHLLILPDGTVQAGRPLGVPGNGTRSVADNVSGIAVALVGDFSSADNPYGARWPARPTKAQLKALDRLALWAMRTYGFGPAAVKGHREVAPSDCPGDRFDLDALRRRLARAVAARRPGKAPPPGLAGAR